MKTDKRQVKSHADLVNLTQFLLPKHWFRPVGNSEGRSASRHPVQTLMEMLWDEGRCGPILIEAICRRTREGRGWRVVAGTSNTGDLGTDFEPLRKRVERINDKLARPDCQWCAHVGYEKSKKRLQLVLDPGKVSVVRRQTDRRRRLRCAPKEIGVEIVGKQYSKGTPVLIVGDYIRCRLSICISGYVHLFHVDANGVVDKIFPARGAKRKTVRAGEAIEFPMDLLKEGHWWKVAEIPGKDSGRQEVVAVIVRLDVRVTSEHLRRLGVGGPARGAIQEKLQFEDLKPGTTAFGIAHYLMQMPSPKEKMRH